MADEKLKKRIARCLGILTKILSQKGLNRRILAEEYGCAVRTIADDIALLREIGFKIRYEQHEYRLSTAIPPLPLQENQILALFIASQLMVLTPLEQKANEAIQQMLSTLSEDAIGFLRELSNRVYIAPGGDLGDTQILFQVYRAVSECRAIRICYEALSSGEEEMHDVDPYGIYLKDRNRSYLRGFSYGAYQQLRSFKLCRIKELTFRGWQFSYPADYSIRKDMENGFWDGEEEHELLIRFHRSVAQLVREREPAQLIEDLPGGFLQVRKRVRNLDEAFYDLLRYGKSATVIEPEELRERLRHELGAWRKNYED